MVRSTLAHCTFFLSLLRPHYLIFQVVVVLYLILIGILLLYMGVVSTSYAVQRYKKMSQHNTEHQQLVDEYPSTSREVQRSKRTKITSVKTFTLRLFVCYFVCANLCCFREPWLCKGLTLLKMNGRSRSRINGTKYLGAEIFCSDVYSVKFITL